ncbi:MAG: hypothetical protein AVDCRST_MAG03-883 [uncultured Rubrobacteraceae bacterium]|uniref:Uncharacterized protein n=1 Tax=uncultured Rubrobacteraceae bacterium TaxID=349277 RepID=A0A6J4NS79_9ACTN|nr:MAG: hypothetical protein AVDCRST_MAG03-883 [uncultured Rubrobacteraceae bacterium]
MFTSIEIFPARGRNERLPQEINAGRTGRRPDPGPAAGTVGFRPRGETLG